MLRKGRIAAACTIVAMTAVLSWAATYWQVQTKLTTAGGTIKVGTKLPQTTAGSVAYNNYTGASVNVLVAAKTGYTIASVTKNGVVQAIPAGTETFPTTFYKAGTVQTLLAGFKTKTLALTTSVTGPGTITPASATVNYNGTAKLTVLPSTTNTLVTEVKVNDVLYAGASFPVTGSVVVNLTGITAATNVTATFENVTANAGADQMVVTGSPVTLSGTATGPATASWSLVSGPVAVDTSAWNTLTPSFTPAVNGTYAFQLTETAAGKVLATSTTQVTVVESVSGYMADKCNGCHNPTNGGAPSNAYAQWAASTHQANNITCITCHTDSAMPTPVNTTTVSAVDFKVLAASAGTVGTNYCAKCHGTVGHNLTAANSCNACHTDVHNPATAFSAEIGAKHIAGKFIGTAVNVGDGKTQYVTQGATCADCHNSTNSVLAGFAAGGHGHISDDPLNPFVHYDWSARTNNGTRQNGNCDRCHTAGGFVKFTGQDPTLAARLNPTTGQPNNVLVCVSCHKNIETGELRNDATPAGNPTTLAGGYFALFSSSAASITAGNTKIEVAFPGFKNSSICVPCHAGRTTDKVFIETINKSNTLNVATGKFGNYTTISTGFYQHAFNMGQTFLGKGAYNFAGAVYVGDNGHNAVQNGASDLQGPCVGCHHSSAASHSLAVTGYTSCQSCHAAGFGATDVEEAKAKFDAGVKVLTALLEEKFNPLRADATKPISTERANVRFGRFGKAAGTAADATTAKNAYGAWYNWHILTNTDPAAFVHNPSYARQILLTTIDYLDGNGAALNGSAEATILASTAVTELEREEAEAFVTTPACGSCHATQTTLVQTGKHAAEVSTHSGACGRCHTTEGYVAFSNLVAADTRSYDGLYTSESYNGTQNVSCSACHDTHGTLRATSANWAPKYAENDAAASVQFKLCTSCHNLVNEAGAPIASGSVVSGTATATKQQHAKDWYRNIASTHYDLATTGVGLSSTVIEGYNVRFNKESACTDCHGHELRADTNQSIATVPTFTIHTEWAQSGHAGGLLKAKFANFTTNGNSARARNLTNAASVMAAGVTAESGPAWEHYDWDSASRQACQKCHTSTGVSNYLDAVAAKNAGTTTTVAYNAANNDFGHLANWTTTKASTQNEMLYCWGCHNNAETGALRVEGAMTLDYKAATTDTANIVINAPGKSAVCVSCHAGRGNVVTLMGTSASTPGRVLDNTTTPKYSATATALHYLNAAATIFKNETKVGYEFAGREYANPVYYKHNTIGCNDCHMPSKSHTLDVVNKDAAGAITALVATNCVTCHTGAYGTALTAGSADAAAFIEEEAEGYKEALAAFNDAMIAKGYVWSSAYPYFFQDFNADGVIDAADQRAKFTHPTTKAVTYTLVPTTDVAALTKAAGWTDVNADGIITDADVANVGPLWTNEGDLGAAHNYNYLLHEAGAYVHNRLYTKRLIYDSIDWIDNGALDNSVVIDGVKYPEAVIWMGAARP